MKLDFKKTFWIGFGFFATSIAWSMYNSYVPIMLEGTFVPQLVKAFGIPAEVNMMGMRFAILTTLTGAVMTFDNIFGVIFQPLFGTLSDRTRTAIGRRMPYITAGLPISALLLVMIPFMNSLWSFMAMVVLFTFTMSAWRAPVVALMPDLTPSVLRSQANGVINLMGGLGSLLAVGLAGVLFNLGGMPAPFVFSALLMVAALILLRVFVKEPAGDAAITTREEGETTQSIGDLPKGERGARTLSLFLLLFAIFFWFNGYNAVETLFTLYAINVLKISTGFAPFLLAFFLIAFMAMAIPAGRLSVRFGRKRLIMIGLAAVGLLFPAMLLSHNIVVVGVMLVIGGCAWALVNINSLPMVLQLAAHKDIGKYTGYYYVFSFSAAITAPILAGFMRDVTGSYNSVFLYAGGAFLAALACMAFVRHGEVETEPEADADPDRDFAIVE